MDTPFRILADDEVVPDKKSRTLERGARLVFTAADGFEVLVDEVILARLVFWAKTNAPNEWMGFVAASYFVDDEGVYLVVRGIVPATGAKATAVTVVTTPAIEADARAMASLCFPDAQVWGWVHSHPGYGTEFSGPDRANQRKWSADSVGLVVDPFAAEGHQLGVYRGPDSERLTRKASQVAAEVDNAPNEISKNVKRTKEPRRGRRGSTGRVFSFLLVPLVFALSAVFLVSSVHREVDRLVAAIGHHGQAMLEANAENTSRATSSTENGKLSIPASASPTTSPRTHSPSTAVCAPVIASCAGETEHSSEF